jgi:hypothetical protein
MGIALAQLSPVAAILNLGLGVWALQRVKQGRRHVKSLAEELSLLAISKWVGH